MGGEAPFEQVGVADGVEGDSIQSGLFGSTSAGLFSERRASSDGQEEPDGDDDESQYVPKHMRLV